MNTEERKHIRRGDLYYADLTPTTGSEQGGVRPVLIIQNDVGNRHSSTVIAAAITGYAKTRHQPTHVALDGMLFGLRKESTILLEQLRTLDKSRLGSYIGSLDGEKMREVDAALEISVGAWDGTAQPKET